MNDGHLIYPLDDLYIHLAATKQLVLHHVWGISYLNGFSSCLSSLLYPLLLAAGSEILGLREWLPLALNLLAGVGAIFYVGALLGRHTRSAGLVLVLLGLIVVGTPLPVVAVTGMEHVWQILLDLFFVDLAVRVLAGDGAPPARWMTWLLPLAAGLSVMIRFEGLFIVSIVGLLLLCRGRFWLAVGVGVGAVLPLAVFGWYSVSQGWSFLPNSVLMKGGSKAMGKWFLLVALVAFAGALRPRVAVRTLIAALVLIVLAILLPPSRRWLAAQKEFIGMYAHVAALVAALAATLCWVWRRQRQPWSTPVLWTGIVLVIALQHLTFATLGWVYRYEAYLMFLGLTAISVTLAQAFPAGEIVPFFRRQPRGWRAAVLLAVVVVGAPLAVRAAWSTRKVTLACHNVYEQQYQMAQFARRFYTGTGLAANDIGAISYYTDSRILDTFGLSSYEVFRARKAGTYNEATMRELLRRYDVRFLVVYDDWATFYGGIPPEWVLVGRWTIPGNVVCASDTVSFYAPDASLAPRLTQALREFAPTLPSDVAQTGAYVAGTAGHE